MIVRRLFGLFVACSLAAAALPTHRTHGGYASGHAAAGAACCGAMACCASGSGCATGACASEPIAAASAPKGASDCPRLAAGCGAATDGIQSGSHDPAVVAAALRGAPGPLRSVREGFGCPAARPAARVPQEPPPRA